MTTRHFDDDDAALLMGDCPACDRHAALSADSPGDGISFTEPLCEPCRDKEVREIGLSRLSFADAVDNGLAFR